MGNNHPETAPTRNPFISVLIIIAFTLAGLFVGNFFGFLVILPFYDFDLALANEFLADPMLDNSGRVPLLLIQSMASVFSFIIAPLLYIRYYEGNIRAPYLVPPAPFLPALLLTVLIAQSFMFVNTPFIEWNMNLDFPDFMSAFERFAQEQELYLKEVTEYVTHFDNAGEFILGMVAIAIIPGIGEELLFRGLIQNKLASMFKNPHVGIWLAAFLFALFHFQFYGVIPRMLLGAIFGYLYWWSGSLLLAVVAHFFNNGFTLMMVYLYQNDMVSFDIEGTAEISSSTILVSGLIFGMLLYYFFKFVKRQDIDEQLAEGL